MKNLEFLATFERFLINFEIDSNKNMKFENDSNIVQFLLKNINHILENGFISREDRFNQKERMFQSIPSRFTNTKNHYFQRFTEVLPMESIEFMKHLEVPFDDEQSSFLWLLIEISQKNIHNVLEIIHHNNELMKCYNEEALMKRHFNEIYQLIVRLDIKKFSIHSGFLNSFYELYPEEQRSLEETNDLSLKYPILNKNEQTFFGEKSVENKDLEFHSTKTPLKSQQVSNANIIKPNSINLHKFSNEDDKIASPSSLNIGIHQQRLDSYNLNCKLIKLTESKLNADQIRQNILRFNDILQIPENTFQKLSKNLKVKSCNISEAKNIMTSTLFQQSVKDIF